MYFIPIFPLTDGVPKESQHHHVTTNRIQQEIAQNGNREKELIAVGKVLTLSEDTLEDKVTTRV